MARVWLRETTFHPCNANDDSLYFRFQCWNGNEKVWFEGGVSTWRLHVLRTKFACQCKLKRVKSQQTIGIFNCDVYADCGRWKGRSTDLNIWASRCDRGMFAAHHKPPKSLCTSLCQAILLIANQHYSIQCSLGALYGAWIPSHNEISYLLLQ